jgi:hypothetical protein
MEDAAKTLVLEMDVFTDLAKKYGFFEIQIVVYPKVKDEILKIKNVVKRMLAECVEYGNWINFINENGYENVEDKSGIIVINFDDIVFKLTNESNDEHPVKISFSEKFLFGWIEKK